MILMIDRVCPLRQRKEAVKLLITRTANMLRRKSLSINKLAWHWLAADAVVIATHGR